LQCGKVFGFVGELAVFIMTNDVDLYFGLGSFETIPKGLF